MADTTFRRAVRAGDPLIFALPGTLAGRTEMHYEVLRAPALSWLVDGSFFWRTRPTDKGPHAMRFLARHRGRVPPDTVTVVVKVTAPEGR